MGRDPPGGDEESAVRPEDLDFTRDERVAAIDDDRYVVATSGQGSPDPDEDALADPLDERRPARQTPEVLLNELSELLAEVDQPHGFALAARFDGEVDQHAVLADDVADMVAELMTWVAGRVDEETPPEAVLGMLLLGSGRSVRYPARALDAVVKDNDLSYDDSIGELLESVADRGFTVPPDDEE